MDIRLSIGSAVRLGLRRAKLAADSNTIYAMLGEYCLGACRFCTQSRTGQANRKFLSRVAWPRFNMDPVLEKLSEAEDIARICVQTLKYPELLPDLLLVVNHITTVCPAPISICMNPVDKSHLLALKQAGVERVGVGLDCASPPTFAKIKPGYSWSRYLRFVQDIVDVFGIGSVHLIVGLGDTDAAILKRTQAFYDMHAYVALFAFTPVRGTELTLSPPDIERYRALQLARYVIVKGMATFADMIFEDERLLSLAMPRSELEPLLASGAPFRTSGCPDCNRPLYNERPGGAMYNYPAPLMAEEKRRALDELNRYLSYKSGDDSD